jgi:hypothetical protein
VTSGLEPKTSNAHKLLAPSQLAVYKRLGVPKIRGCLRISGVSPDIQIAPFNNNIETLRRAVAERVFLVKENGAYCEPPKPMIGLFETRLGPVRDLLKPFLPSTFPLSFSATVETFRGCKKKRYERALEKIRQTRTNLLEESAVKVFVKYEKTDRTTKEDPVPRVISPRTPEFNLRLARYLRKMEEPIFDALGDLFNHKTVMKGVTMETTASLLREKWESFKNPVAVGLDASRFDQHVSKEALEFEHTIYPMCVKTCKHKDKLKALLKYQTKNRCSGYTEDGNLKYVIEGTRMSGDMNTSLGNCVLMCMMIKAYSMFCGVNMHLANNGDDCVVFMEKGDLPKFSRSLNRWFREMGFNMVVEEPSYDFEDIEFCQTRPVWDGTMWVMCRNPWTATAKDSVLLRDPKNVSTAFLKTWLHAVGTGGLALAGGLPVFQSFYSLMQRSGQLSRKNRKGRTVREDYYLPWSMREENLRGGRVSGSVTDEARASFYFAFGVTPDEQVALEAHYDSMSIATMRSQDWHPRNVFPFKI